VVEGKGSKGVLEKNAVKYEYLVNLVFYCRTKVNRVREVKAEITPRGLRVCWENFLCLLGK
jgi:hypothetical protein